MSRVEVTDLDIAIHCRERLLRWVDCQIKSVDPQEHFPDEWGHGRTSQELYEMGLKVDEDFRVLRDVVQVALDEVRREETARG